MFSLCLRLNCWCRFCLCHMHIPVRVAERREAKCERNWCDDHASCAIGQSGGRAATPEPSVGRRGLCQRSLDVFHWRPGTLDIAGKRETGQQRSESGHYDDDDERGPESLERGGLTAVRRPGHEHRRNSGNSDRSAHLPHRFHQSRGQSDILTGYSRKCSNLN
jgi:hypothetical protein